jgi:F-box protein 11
MKNTYIVSKNPGHFKSIQAALDIALENSTILIQTGIYVENLIIQKGGITMQPQDEKDDVICVVTQGPTILINIKPEHTCTIIGLKISHSGTNQNKFHL